MRRLAVVVGALVILTISAVVVQAATTGDERIYACVNNGDGSMRQVASASSTCPKGWHQISWSAENAPAQSISTYVKTDSDVIETGDSIGFLAVLCNDGDVATGGGYIIHESVKVINDAPEFGGPSVNDVAVGWNVEVVVTPPQSSAFAVYANCLHIG